MLQSLSSKECGVSEQSIHSSKFLNLQKLIFSWKSYQTMRTLVEGIKLNYSLCLQLSSRIITKLLNHDQTDADTFYLQLLMSVSVWLQSKLTNPKLCNCIRVFACSKIFDTLDVDLKNFQGKGIFPDILTEKYKKHRGLTGLIS